MKLILSLFVVIALVGAAMGNEAVASECTIQLEDGEVLNEKIYTKGKACYEFSLNIASTTEQVRTGFKTYCESRSANSQCMESVTSDANACFNATEQTKFRLFRQSKENEYELGCRDNGLRLAEVFEATTINRFLTPEQCRENATIALGRADNQDVNGELIFEYKVMKQLLVCLNDHKGHDHDDLLTKMITMGTEIMDGMKCIKDGSDVLCKTLVDDN